MWSAWRWWEREKKSSIHCRNSNHIDARILGILGIIDSRSTERPWTFSPVSSIRQVTVASCLCQQRKYSAFSSLAPNAVPKHVVVLTYTWNVKFVDLDKILFSGNSASSQLQGCTLKASKEHDSVSSSVLDSRQFRHRTQNSPTRHWGIRRPQAKTLPLCRHYASPYSSMQYRPTKHESPQWEPAPPKIPSCLQVCSCVFEHLWRPNVTSQTEGFCPNR